jgi:universal stress protein E
MSTARFKSILVVITDPFARSQPALAKATAIARRCGSSLSLFNSFMLPQPVSGVPMESREAVIASEIRQRRERLRALAAGLHLRKANCIVRWDYPAHEAIVREVLKSNPDLLVTDSHRRGRLARWLLSNTDWELMRACPCPMWFVRSASLPRRLHVLVAVDPRHSHAKPTRLDDRLLRTAVALIDQLDGRIAIVHAYEAPAASTSGMLMEPVRLPRSPRRAQEFIADTTRAVASLAANHDVEASDCIVQEGVTRDVIATAARRSGADLLVMGAVSRSQIARATIGSTAEAVIDHVDCDLFIVKPAGFKSPVRRSHFKEGRVHPAA